MNVIIPFHKRDQASAEYLLHVLMQTGEGTGCKYWLQYGDHVATLNMEDTLLEFCNSRQAVFSNTLPDIRIPEKMISEDPNLLDYGQPHTRRSKFRKWKHLQWNLCLYKYINLLDSFLILEPDSVILKDGWLADIEDGFRNSVLPVYGHLKYGQIDGRKYPTHWAGSSVYNSRELRKLDLEKYFYERFNNPWWPLRNRPGTRTANNCFWGPLFSGYDISYDYFIYALYWITRSGSENPDDWPDTGNEDASQHIICDFNTRLDTQEIVERYFGSLSLFHGAKSDTVRIAVARQMAAEGVEKFNYPIGGPPSINISDDIHTLRRLKDRFKGERCFIIGNGPSLKNTDLRKLAGEFTFGLNRIYLNYEAMGFEPTFYCCVNSLVIEQFYREINRIKSIKFVREGTENLITDHINTWFVRSLDGHDFNREFESCGWYEGWTVTYCAMQVAYYLGFSTVILVGVDHNFQNVGRPNQAVEADSSDQNHFHPDYFGKGIKWHYPDLERSEKSYRIARKVYRSDGRQILDATVGGKLTVFPRVYYNDVTGSITGKIRNMINPFRLFNSDN